MSEWLVYIEKNKLREKKELQKGISVEGKWSFDNLSLDEKIAFVEMSGNKKTPNAAPLSPKAKLEAETDANLQQNWLQNSQKNRSNKISGTIGREARCRPYL